jgi:hypothetical protein
MRQIFLCLTSLVALVLLAAASPTVAQTQGTDQVVGDIANIIFKEAEKRAIEEYYKRFPGAKTESDEDTKGEDESEAKKDKGKKDKKAKGKGRGNGLPPGLAKRDQLPPGLAKRGNRLPPGLMKSDLPPNLEKGLPDLPEDVERVVVDDDVLLVQRGTDLILDVLEGVIRGQ